MYELLDVCSLLINSRKLTLSCKFCSSFELQMKVRNPEWCNAGNQTTSGVSKLPRNRKLLYSLVEESDPFGLIVLAQLRC